VTLPEPLLGPGDRVLPEDHPFPAVVIRERSPLRSAKFPLEMWPPFVTEAVLSAPPIVISVEALRPGAVVQVPRLPASVAVLAERIGHAKDPSELEMRLEMEPFEEGMWPPPPKGLVEADFLPLLERYIADLEMNGLRLAKPLSELLDSGATIRFREGGRSLAEMLKLAASSMRFVVAAQPAGQSAPLVLNGRMAEAVYDLELAPAVRETLRRLIRAIGAANAVARLAEMNEVPAPWLGKALAEEFAGGMRFVQEAVVGVLRGTISKEAYEAEAKRLETLHGWTAKLSTGQDYVPAPPPSHDDTG
jgi:hypothetical protein